MNIYIASCSPDGGMYQYRLSDEGKLSFVNKTDCDRPMYAVIDGEKMYILLRAPFKENNESGLVQYDIAEDGTLKNPTEPVSTKGIVACHLTVKNSAVYCVNYLSGNVIKMPDTVVAHSGKGVHPTRQEAPHTHFAGFTPDGKYLCVTDLGLDTVFLYHPDMTLKDRVKVPEGHGARHLVFSDDGKYMFVANELESTVSSFEYDGESLSYIETVSCLPEENHFESTASAIRYHEDKIYVSNRGHDSVSILCHKKGRMTLSGTIDCGGAGPRDFDIIKGFIVATNEKSGNVTVTDLKTHEKTFELTDIKAPLCVTFQKNKCDCFV